MPNTIGNNRRTYSPAELREAVLDVEGAERAVAAAKSRVGMMIKEAFRERNSVVAAIDHSLLLKIIQGKTYSRPAVERVIEHLILVDSQHLEG